MLQNRAIRPTALEPFKRFHARGNDLELRTRHLADNRLSHERLPPACRLPVSHNDVGFGQLANGAEIKLPVISMHYEPKRPRARSKPARAL